jgi:hypothetical protein
MATKGRTPIPKSQEEISNSFIEPYDKLGRGNPNTPTTMNRGEQISFKDDTTKPFTLGIQDIDETLFYYFNNVIKPTVYQNGQRIAVPLKYANTERWNSIQKNGFMRDKKGKIMSPVIVFKRNNIKSETGIGSKIDANRLHNFKYFQKSYSKQNAYSQFNTLNNASPIKESYAVVIPDYVTITYNCVIFTYYMEQLNKIVEAINYAANAYWGDPSRFKFKALIDSFSTVTERNDGDNRIVKSTFDLNLKGYLIPDLIQKDLVSPKKVLSVGKINVVSEILSTDPNL